MLSPHVLLTLLVIGAGAAFGQSPFTVRAGDYAPKIVWNEILLAPGGNGKAPNGFPGRVTVLAVFPNVSANLSLVSQWNELVAQFADQPVDFVWVASEPDATLAPWLAQHPVSGWLLQDLEGETERAYGIEMMGAVMIDLNGTIAGFSFGLPAEQQIKAVQEGSVLAIQGAPTDSQMEAILAGRAVRLDAEPLRFPKQEPKPDIPPSYEVHISPSTTVGNHGSEGPDHFIQRGFDLRAMISRVWRKDPSRIVLPAVLDNDNTYDFVLVPPREMEPREIDSLMQSEIEKYFKVSAAVETRSMDVYVMTVVDGKGPVAKTGDESFGGSMSWSGREYVTVTREDGGPVTAEMLRAAASNLDLPSSGISNISARNGTIDDFRKALEEGLSRPIVDETKMNGTYDLVVSGRARTNEEFIEMLRDQAGIVLTPARQDIEMLVVRTRP